MAPSISSSGGLNGVRRFDAAREQARERRISQPHGSRDIYEKALTFVALAADRDGYLVGNPAGVNRSHVHLDRQTKSSKSDKIRRLAET